MCLAGVEVLRIPEHAKKSAKSNRRTMTQKQLKSHVKESPSINLPLSTAVLWVDNHLKLNNCSAISIFSHHCQNYNVSSEFIANPNPFSMRGSPFRAHSTPHCLFIF